ncbi:hypothetical protein Vafri_1741 [Volvox africanus]|nr:hypothetical protein Vafri_1741 [Volvox africanus]
MPGPVLSSSAFTFSILLLIVMSAKISLPQPHGEYGAKHLTDSSEGQLAQLEADVYSVQCGTGSCFAEAIANKSVYTVVLVSDVVLRAADWSTVSPIPVLLERNLTITGTAIQRPKKLNLGFLSSYIRLVGSVVLTLEALVLEDWRRLSATRLPGLDIIASNTSAHPGAMDGGQQPPAQQQSEDLTTSVLPVLMMRNTAITYWVCAPPEVGKTAAASVKRPPQLPGSNRYESPAVPWPPYVAQCNSSETAAPLERCWARVSCFLDFGLDAHDLSPNNVTIVHSGYLLLLEQTYSLCHTLTPQDCLDMFGYFGCENYLLSLKYKMMSTPSPSPYSSLLPPPGARASSSGVSVPAPADDSSGGRLGQGRGKHVALMALGAALGSNLTIIIFTVAFFIYRRRRGHLLSTRLFIIFPKVPPSVPAAPPSAAAAVAGTSAAAAPPPGVPPASSSYIDQDQIGISTTSTPGENNSSGGLAPATAAAALPLDNHAYIVDDDTTKQVLIELSGPPSERSTDMASAMARCGNNPQGMNSMAAVVNNAAVTGPVIVGEGGSATGIPATADDSSVQCSSDPTSCTPSAAATTPREVVITPYTPTRADLVLGVRVRFAAPDHQDQACNPKTAALLVCHSRPRPTEQQAQEAVSRQTTARESKRQQHTMKMQSLTVQQCAAGSSSSSKGLSSCGGENLKSVKGEQMEVMQHIMSGACDNMTRTTPNTCVSVATRPCFPSSCLASKGSAATRPSSGAANTNNNGSSDTLTSSSPQHLCPQRRQQGYSRTSGSSANTVLLPPPSQSRDDASMGQGMVNDGPRDRATIPGSHGPIHQAIDSGQAADGEDDVVTLLPVLRGKGNFGRVYEGLWRGQAVAVKVLLLEHLAALGMSLPGHTTHLSQQTYSLWQDSTCWRNGSSWLHGSAEEEHDEQEVRDKEGQLTTGEVAESMMKEVGVAGPSPCGGHLAGSAADLAADCNEALLSPIPLPLQPQAKVAVTDIPNHNTDHYHMLTSLQQEVQVLGRCCHVNVVRLLAACLTPPQVCLVMELMDTSLDRLLYGRNQGCHESRLLSSDDICSYAGPSKPPQLLLPLTKALHIAAQIAAALEYLHPTIVHRDLKPANVLLNNPLSDFPVVKLTDFGLSRIRMGTLATLHPEAGTPSYLAPECYDSRQNIIVHQSDMYSLGVLIWALLSGRRPWQGCSIPAVAYKVVVLGERPPLEQISRRRCPRRLRQLVMQCWDPDPLRRPAAAEMAKELRSMLAAQLASGDGETSIPHGHTPLQAGPSTAGPTSNLALPPISRAGPEPRALSLAASSLLSNNSMTQQLEGLELEMSNVT